MLFGAVFTMLASYPLFLLLETRDPAIIMLAMVVAVVAGRCAVFAVQPSYYLDLFDVRLRFSGMVLAREVTGALIGGMLPLAAATAAAGGRPVAGRPDHGRAEPRHGDSAAACARGHRNASGSRATHRRSQDARHDFANDSGNGRLMMHDLTGKTAVVTGGAGGIGAAVARLLGSRGAKVALLDLAEESAVAKALELAVDGMEAMGVPVDVRRRADVSRALDAVVARFGPIDIVVNNAAVVVIAAFLDMTDEQWSSSMDTNLTGYFVVAQEALRRMARLDGGHVVNIASINAMIANSDQTAYATAKAGITALTRAIAFELGPQGLTANTVLSGQIDTPFAAAALTPGAAQAARAAHPRRAVWPARGGRRACGVPRQPGRVLHQRPDHHRRWRLADGRHPRRGQVGRARRAHGARSLRCRRNAATKALSAGGVCRRDG